MSKTKNKPKAKATKKKVALSISTKKKKNSITKAKPKKAAKPAKNVSKKAAKVKAKLVKKAVAKSIKTKKVVSTKLKAAKKKVVKKKAVKKSVPKKAIKVVKVTAKSKVASKPVKQSNKSLEKKTKKLKEVKQVIAGTEKNIKIGVKTKKQIVPIVPLPVIEVADYPKTRVKTILLSQPRPEGDKHPFFDLAKKHNINLVFRQFIKVEGVPARDFRAQRIDILEHKAVILNSKMAVDHYFRMCNEMRVTVPESMKYFCTNEATAYYLQKYIQYRKRKIFFGHQSIQDLIDAIKKNKEEKFLFPASDVNREQICEFLEALNIKYTKAVMYKTVSADLSDIKNLSEYDIIIFFTPAGVNALKQNFPNFKQGNTRIGCFGHTAANTIKKLGYRLDIYAPNPKYPSMFAALDDYIKQANKR